MSANITKLNNYRNGSWVESTNNNWLEVLNPAISESISEVPPLSSSEEVNETVQNALKAIHSWRRTPGTSRIQYLFKLEELLEENLEEMAKPLEPKF